MKSIFFNLRNHVNYMIIFRTSIIIFICIETLLKLNLMKEMHKLELIIDVILGFR